MTWSLHLRKKNAPNLENTNHQKAPLKHTFRVREAIESKSPSPRRCIPDREVHKTWP